MASVTTIDCGAIAVLDQVYLASAIKAHPFRLQPRALFVVAGRGAQADLAARVDDAMPRHLIRAHAHRPANRARRARRAERAGDLPIGDNAPARDAAHEQVDAREEGGGRGLHCARDARRINLQATRERSRPAAAGLQPAQAGFVFVLRRIMHFKNLGSG